MTRRLSSLSEVSKPRFLRGSCWDSIGVPDWPSSKRDLQILLQMKVGVVWLLSQTAQFKTRLANLV